MFGYLTLQNHQMTWKMNRGYRNYYCGVCFGLGQNYGQLPRMLLSYDVALLAIMVGCHDMPLQKRFPCHGKKKEKKCRFCTEAWDQIAALDILLFQEKLKDDINDDRSILAALGRLVYAKPIRRAQKRYPRMAERISEGYKEMYGLERQNSRIRPIEERFADMMEEAVGTFRALEPWEAAYIRGISKWVYYIDALDDYEKDYKKKKFNALKEADASTFYEYTRKHLPVIASDLQYLYKDIWAALEQMPEGKEPERNLLRALIISGIPQTTARILSGRTLFKKKVGSAWDYDDEIYAGAGHA